MVTFQQNQTSQFPLSQPLCQSKLFQLLKTLYESGVSLPISVIKKVKSIFKNVTFEEAYIYSGRPIPTSHDSLYQFTLQTHKSILQHTCCNLKFQEKNEQKLSQYIKSILINYDKNMINCNINKDWIVNMKMVVVIKMSICKYFLKKHLENECQYCFVGHFTVKRNKKYRPTIWHSCLWQKLNSTRIIT